MNIAFLLPSLLYGLFLFASTGSVLLLLLSGTTMLVWLFVRSGQQDLSQEVSFVSGRVYLGKRRLPLSPLLWGVTLRTRIYEAAFTQDIAERSRQLPPGMQAMHATGEFIDLTPTEVRPHLIAIGPTGSGKTELIRRIATGFRGAKFAIDFKSGEGLGHLVPMDRLITNQSSPDEVAAFFDLLGSKSSLKLPLILMVDELGEAIKDREIATQLERYAAQGRSNRTFLLLANQTLSMVPRTIWVNCAVRIALGADAVDVAQLQIAAKPPAESNGLRHGLARIGEASSVIYLPDYLGLASQASDDLGDDRPPASDSLNLIGQVGADQSTAGSDKPKRFNFPLWRMVVHPAQRRQVSAAAKQQVGHRSSGEVAGADTVTDIATRLANLGHRIKRN